jgi:predicted transcriptional regulator
VTIEGTRRCSAVSGDEVRNVMHRGVITCSPDLPGPKVAQMMAAHRIHSVVVQAPGLTPRVITDADLIEAVHAGTLEASSAGELARHCPLVRPSDSLEDAVSEMHRCSTTHAVVVREPLRPVGVVSWLDLAEAIAPP